MNKIKNVASNVASFLAPKVVYFNSMAVGF
jgi:hypothetical protein